MSNEVVPVSQTTVSRLMSDGSIERIDPLEQALPTGLVPITAAEGGGFAGVGVKDANGAVRARITFADDGGIVIATLDADGGLVTELFFIGTAATFHHGDVAIADSLALPEVVDGSALPTEDPGDGKVWLNGAVLQIGAVT